MATASLLSFSLLNRFVSCYFSSILFVVYLCFSCTISASPGLSSDQQTCISKVESMRETYDSWAPTYEQEKFHAELAADFMTYIPVLPGSSVLDLGCGTGLVAILAKKRVGPAGNVIGIDNSPGMLRHAARAARRARLPIKWLKGDINDVRTPLIVEYGIGRGSGFYDAITCASAFLFTEDDGVNALREWGNLLKPDGRIIFNTPDQRQDLSEYAIVIAARRMGIPTPWSLKPIGSVEDVEALIAQTGNLEVDRVFKGQSYGTEEISVEEGARRVNSIVSLKFFECFDQYELARLAIEVFVEEFNKVKNENDVYIIDNVYYVGIAKRVRAN